MSDNIEIPEIEADDVIETPDEENSVAYTLAVAAIGMVAGAGVWCGAKKLTHKLEEAVNRKMMEKMLKENVEPDQKE
jgi:hypothetical protein